MEYFGKLIIVNLRELTLKGQQFGLELVIRVRTRNDGDGHARERITAAGDLRRVAGAQARGTREREASQAFQN